ncbi:MULTISPECIES: hypothetical protein [unclassified Gilliamella]|uniref:hypothetical protein n=1 Tax=unclassified Gilliamella TaxID=2685620 RepID=UPI0013207CBB|nr:MULTISPECIES: hypothetical protein [unclassified Gilliamella]MWN32793.1 hypothetical protein [Gilliamella sp. Pra-s60]MWP30278.1 hypothetical protein [Gilliamella sp. Pra-s54]
MLSEKVSLSTHGLPLYLTSNGGITTIMTPSPDNVGMTRIKLTEPRASSDQIKIFNPNSLS